MPREALKSRLKLAPRIFSAAVRHWVDQNLLVERGPVLARTGFTVQFTQQQKERVAALMQRFESSPAAPPGLKECQLEVGEEVLNVLIERGDLVQAGEDVLFRKSDYDHMVQAVLDHLKAHGTLTVAEFRDLFQTSRKYALALLEHLDTKRITVRDGDYRKLFE